MTEILNSLSTTNALLTLIAIILVIGNWRQIAEVALYVAVGIATVAVVIYFFGWHSLPPHSRKVFSRAVYAG
jgi:hypothetical protein